MHNVSIMVFSVESAMKTDGYLVNARRRLKRISEDTVEDIDDKRKITESTLRMHPEFHLTTKKGLCFTMRVHTQEKHAN